MGETCTVLREKDQRMNLKKPYIQRIEQGQGD